MMINKAIIIKKIAYKWNLICTYWDLCESNSITINEPNRNLDIRIVFEIALFIWGSLEIFYFTKNCDDLKREPIWDIALTNYICSYLVLFTYLIYCLNCRNHTEKIQELEEVITREIQFDISIQNENENENKNESIDV